MNSKTGTLYADNSIEIHCICQQKSSVQLTHQTVAPETMVLLVPQNPEKCKKWVYIDLFYQKCY